MSLPKGQEQQVQDFLVYASHVAAMAPGTNIGAATPVNLMQPPAQPKTPTGEKEKKIKPKERLEKQKSAMEKKVINDSVAYIKSIAELRGRIFFGP